MELANCRRCGDLYQSTGARFCSACLKLEEEEYHMVRQYIREHPDAPVLQVSQATGVSTTRIYEFVRKGKLIAHSTESDLAVECASCGARIVSGRLCDKCQAALGGRSETSHERLGKVRGRVHLQNRFRRLD